MFCHITLEHEVQLEPRYFGPQVLENVRKQLFAEVEGKCVRTYGFVIAITAVDEIGEGVLKVGMMGLAVFVVKYKAIVFRPFKGQTLDAIVTQVNGVGLFTEIGPLPCFISKNHIPSTMKFGYYLDQPCYEDQDKHTVIRKGDAVRLKIIGVNYGSSVCSVGTMMDDYLGKIQDDEEAVPKCKKRKAADDDDEVNVGDNKKRKLSCPNVF